MEQTAADLQQLKGVGSILVQRLKEAGLDGFSKIAEADAAELRKIKGLNPRTISSIQAQAKELAAQAGSDRQAAIDALVKRLGEVKEQVQALAQATRDRFGAELTGKHGKKMSSDLVSIEDTLAKLNLSGKKGAKRAGKALNKVQKRVSGLAEDASLKKVRKTLKRARKTVRKAVE
ncbi:DNA-binding protein [Geomonas limicola]|uniref:DNA-binding protein n=1 Tax=Geomonas limicola TaxID=2740186 RepID=A0A6V8N4G2_9BACT|nr:helix-hairpin-helix domain-containing protein [Geomonas limicola]GFO66503.1 DNA-binding protein [Geomonas limicola]